jgi:O-antigen/teichoic acid export membrane protein
MYDADILGRAAMVLAIVNISALIVCLQYDQAVVVAGHADLPFLLLLSLGTATVWALLLYGVILLDGTGFWFGRQHLLASYGINWILPFLIFVYGLFTLLVNLGLRRNTLVKVSLGRFVYYGGGALIQIIGSLSLGASESVFLIAQSLAAIIAIVCLLPYREMMTWVRDSLGVRHTLSGILRVARVYVRFPKYQMGDGFINALSVYMPIVFLRVAFSDAWAGWYYMGWRLLAAPTTLVAQAVGQVFYRDSAERERNGMEQRRSVETVVAALVRSSIPAAIAVTIGVPIVVDILLGTGWTPVIGIVRAMLIAAIVTFCSAPVSMLLTVKGLQANALRYSLVLFGVGLFGLGVGWWFRSGIISVLGYSVLRGLVLISFLGYIVASVKGRVGTIIRRVLPSLLGGVLTVAIAAGLWLTGVLYKLPGMLAVSALLCLLLWRDIRRGDWLEEQGT